MKREFKLIDYLEVNNELPRDDSSVGQRLLQLDLKQRNAIWRIDKLYQNFFNFSLLAFIFNCVLSGVIIFSEHGEVSKTKSVFITNTLFLFMKFTSIYYVKKSDKNVFYSAYLTKKIQFNDVDPDKIITQQNTI